MILKENIETVTNKYIRVNSVYEMRSLQNIWYIFRGTLMDGPIW